MENKRDSFIFYRSFFECTKPLPPEQKAQLFDAICEYALNQKESELEAIPEAMFGLIKPQLEANIKKYLNGIKPKQKQNRSKPEAKKEQPKSKPEGNVNDNVNDNVSSTLSRMKDFKPKDIIEAWSNNITSDRENIGEVGSVNEMINKLHDFTKIHNSINNYALYLQDKNKSPHKLFFYIRDKIYLDHQKEYISESMKIQEELKKFGA